MLVEWPHVSYHSKCFSVNGYGCCYDKCWLNGRMYVITANVSVSKAMDVAMVNACLMASCKLSQQTFQCQRLWMLL